MATKAKSESEEIAAVRSTVVESDEIETFRDIDTKPIALVQSRIDHDAAYTALWNRVSRLKRDIRLEIKEREKRLDALEETMSRVQTFMTIFKWLGGLVLATALGSVIVVATKIFTWGETSGQSEIRIQVLEREVESLQSQQLKSLIQKVVP